MEFLILRWNLLTVVAHVSLKREMDDNNNRSISNIPKTGAAIHRRHRETVSNWDKSAMAAE